MLAERAIAFNKQMHVLRENRTEDIFTRLGYVFPSDIRMKNFGRSPHVAFNPGAVLEGRRLYVLPRLIFDYYKYVSSIGLFSIPIEDVLEQNIAGPFDTEIILWPKNLWEFKGCEDARVTRVGDEYWVLYTGNRHLERERPEVGPPYEFQGFARFDLSWREKDRKYLQMVAENISQIKDSAFLDVRGSQASMLLRPTIRGVGVGWRGLADVKSGTVYLNTLEPVLPVAEWELKVGWSTNAVKIGEDEYLIGWHGVLKHDYSYRNGFAILDGEGNLLGLTHYLLAPKGVIEEYGDRPFVIFGNGLVLYKDLVLWVGGISDYAIGFFLAPLDEILSRVRWVRG